jgi:predicted transcriptional regulator
MSRDHLTSTEQSILSRLDVVGPCSSWEVAKSLDLSHRLVMAYLWQLRRHGWATERERVWRLTRRRP